MCPAEPGRASVHVPANTWYYRKSRAEELKSNTRELAFVWSKFYHLEIIASDLPKFLTYKCVTV